MLIKVANPVQLTPGPSDLFSPHLKPFPLRILPRPVPHYIHSPGNLQVWPRSQLPRLVIHRAQGRVIAGGFANVHSH